MLGPLPPHAQIEDFLPAAEHIRVLSWVLANSAQFQAATVTSGAIGSEYEVTPRFRSALKSKNLGPFEPMLKKYLLGALQRISDKISLPLAPQSLELEFTAYGDNAFFAPHIDIPTGKNRAALSDQPGQDRVLSAVYYFHREPRSYSGGALRLFRFGADPARAALASSEFVDVEPLNNSLVAFPSTAIHEVRRVRCSSQSFEDYRFALNCWYCRAL